MSERITGELRRRMDTLGWYDEDGSIVFTTSGLPASDVACLAIDAETFGELCDAIDSIHANLERENDRLKCELDRVLGELDEMHKTDGISDNTGGFMQNAEHHAWAPESHYVMLPKDADGVPIHIGDMMEGVDKYDSLKKVMGKVITISFESDEITDVAIQAWSSDGKSWHRAYLDPNASVYRHHHAPTVEDVLREFAYGLGVPVADSYIAASAAKLRLAGDAE